MSFVIFLSIISGVTIALAVGINLFNIQNRGMATAFILMNARIGGFAGSSMIGLLLANMCSVIFYMYGALLISKFNLFVGFLQWKISVLNAFTIEFQVVFLSLCR